MKTTDNPPINLQAVSVCRLEGPLERQQARDFLDAHHYLKDVKAVGEQIWYGVFDECKQWLGVLVFCAASRRLHA